MKYGTAVIGLLIVITGCGRGGSQGDSDVIEPTLEVPADQRNLPPATAPAPRPAASQPTTAPEPTSVPYRVLGPAEIVATAMLQVNDEFITLKQALHPIRQQLAAAGARGDEDAFRRVALALIRTEVRRQVQQTLVAAEAELRLGEREKEFVESELKRTLREIITTMGGSKTAFVELLKREGTTLETWQADARRALMVKVYLQQRFQPQISVNRKIMWDYYRSHLDQFRQLPQVRMQIIAVSVAAVADGARIVTPAQREAWKNKARELIDQAAKALAQKQDFAEVAKKFSKGPMGPEGGRWPIMEQGSFRHQQVEKAAFAQEPGQTSGVIETDAGFFIVKTLKRQDGEVMAFEAVQDEIVRKLREQRHQQLSSKYMAELAERAIIQAADRFEIAAVNAAVQRYLRR